MKIRRLKLGGFKSFVEPTELRIEPGLTGVVGPNGCGKSNLLEAIRWVMGEGSPKSLRGSGMEDVIFAGTNARPARNMAEVTISIDNAARTAPTELNDADVLEVTRRIERDAGSAYRVNGGEVREIQVNLDPRRLEALNLPLSQVAVKLAAENLDVPGGQVRDPRARGDAQRVVGADQVGDDVVERLQVAGVNGEPRSKNEKSTYAIRCYLSIQFKL